MDSIATDKDGNLCVAYREHTPDFQDIWGEVKCLYGKEWVSIGGRIGKQRMAISTNLFINRDGRMFFSSVECPYLNAPVQECVIRVYTFDGNSWVQIGSDIISESGFYLQKPYITIVPSGDIYVVGGTYFTKEVWRHDGNNWVRIEYVYHGYYWPHYGILTDSYGMVYLIASSPSAAGRINVWDGSQWLPLDGEIYRVNPSSVSFLSFGISPSDLLLVAFNEGNSLYVDFFNGEWVPMGGMLNTLPEYEASMTVPMGAIAFDPYNETPYVAFLEKRSESEYGIVLKHYTSYCWNKWEVDLDILQYGSTTSPLLAINNRGEVFISWWNFSTGTHLMKSTMPLPSLPQEPPTEYGLYCGGNLKLNGQLKVNGPLSDIYVSGDVEVNGKLILTGDLYYGKSYINHGNVDVAGAIKEMKDAENLPLPPSISFDNFKALANIVFEEGEVYERRNGELIKVADDLYIDPSGAKWRYHSQGKKKAGFWAIEGDYSSNLTGTIYFSTDLKNPDHKITINGTLVVKGELSDSGELYIKTKPDEWALVVGKDAFLRDKTDVWGKIYVGGNLKLPDTVGTEPIPIAKYHDKGKVYVMGDCFINGRFHINNLDLVQRVGEYVGRSEFGKDSVYLGTIPIGEVRLGEPSIGILLFTQNESYKNEITYIAQPLTSPIYLNINTVAMSDNAFYTPVIFATEGLPKALANQCVLKHILREKGYAGEITDIFYIPPYDFYAVGEDNVIYYLAGLDFFPLEVNQHTLNMRNELAEHRNEYILSHPERVKERLERAREEWRELSSCVAPKASQVSLSPKGFSTKVSEVRIGDYCEMALNGFDEVGIETSAIKIAMWWGDCKLYYERDKNSMPEFCTGFYSKLFLNIIDAATYGADAVTKMLKAEGNTDIWNKAYRHTVEIILNSAILAAFRSKEMWFGYCYYGPLCMMPSFTSKEDWNNLVAYMAGGITLYTGVVSSDMDNKRDSMGLIQYCRIRESNTDKAPIPYCVAGYVIREYYQNYNYSATFYGTFTYRWSEDAWANLINKELTGSFCDNNYVNFFAYGYTGGCDTEEAVKNGFQNLNPNFVTLEITSAKNHDFKVVSIWDCFTTGQCSKIVHIKVNIGEFTETGLLGRTFIWTPWQDSRCPNAPRIKWEGGWGGGEGGGGGGCSIVFPGNWEAVGAIGIVYLYLIVRRSRKGGKK